jgi:hypothetical protein
MAVLCVAVAVARPGHAAEYSVEVLVDDEDDVNQLYYDGEITEEERDRLLTLLLAKVDLNRATREELYELPGFTWQIADAVIERRALAGGIKNVDAIGDVEGMTPEILAQSRPFMTARSPTEERPYEIASETGGIGRFGSSDPAFYELLRGRAWTHASAGILFTARPMLGDMYGAPAGGSLSAQGYATRPELTHFYGSWDGPRLAAVAGSYRIGYGLRLTLDNTRKLRPHGFFANEDFYQSNESGRLSPIDGFVGAAVRARFLPVGRGWFDVSAFGSWWNKDIYFSDLSYDRGSDQPFIVDSETGEPIPYATLNDVVRERLAGGNLTYHLTRRISAGVTGYYGDFKLNVDAPDVKIAVASRYPEDRPTFGAVGLNANAGVGRFDAAAEVALTDQGAPAVLAMAWFEPTPRLQVIPSFRYYSPDYDNPYARGEADADEYLGSRARDELGGRLQAVFRPFHLLGLRGDVNLWRRTNPPLYDESGNLLIPDLAPTVDLKTFVRLDLHPTSRELLAFWFGLHDKDLAHGGRELAYVSDTQPGGLRWYWAAMARTTRLRRFTIAAMFKQILEDTASFDDRFDKTWYAWLRVSAQPFRGSIIAARLKYNDQYTDDVPARTRNTRECDYEDAGLAGDPVPAACRGESYVSLYVQASQRLWANAAVKLRIEWQHFTDSREKWRPLDAPWPTRDEVLIKGHFTAKF